MLDLPSPTNTALRSQQQLNTPKGEKGLHFYFVNDNLLFELYFGGGGISTLIAESFFGAPCL